LVHTEHGIFYAGQSPGDGLPVPLTLRHFGGTEQGGFGEAVMMGIFGQTRSGKSILAAQLLAGFAAHPSMGLLVLDPQGEFGRDRFAAGDHRVDFSIRRLLGELHTPRTITVTSTDDVALEGCEAFTEMLRRAGFFEELGFKGANKEREASERMAALLGDLNDEGGRRRPIRDLRAGDLRLLVKDLSRFADVIYASRPGTTPGEGQRALDVMARFELDHARLSRIWLKTLESFRTDMGRVPLSQLIGQVLQERAVVVLSFAQEHGNDAVPYFLLNEILTRLRHVIHRSFQSGAGSNALVVLDEAHLFAGEHASECADGVRTRTLLAQSVRMTGKYGVGWMFVTQTLHDFDKTILRQLQVKVFGQGFKIGADREFVEMELGREGFARYCSLPDPKRTGRYTFMITGPIVALGSLGTPLVLQSFRSSADLIRSNPHCFGEVEGERGKGKGKSGEGEVESGGVWVMGNGQLVMGVESEGRSERWAGYQRMVHTMGGGSSARSITMSLALRESRAASRGRGGMRLSVGGGHCAGCGDGVAGGVRWWLSLRTGRARCALSLI
ncbi:MAG: ATP-binding protein, partial [Chloroflexaceae bacterium]|nr:ATP-binding protein [Chloroflexaceae bacterium]